VTGEVEGLARQVRGLGKHFHKLIIAATTQELIDAEGKVFVPD
jgi:hypothetical protein